MKFESAVPSPQVTNLCDKLRHATQDVHREVRMKEKLEEELEMLAKQRDEAQAKEKEESDAVRAASRTIDALHQAARDQRAQLDRVVKESDSLAARLLEQQRDNDRLRADLSKVRADCKDKGSELLRQEEVISRMRAEVNKVQHTVDTMFTRLGLQQQRNKQVPHTALTVSVTLFWPMFLFWG